MVAAGHLTEVPIESVYSGVVSLRGTRLMIFLVELNQMEAWVPISPVLTLRHSPRRNCLSRLVLSLETKKGTSYLSRRLSTDFKLLVYGGMRDSPTVYVEWVSFPARQRPTFGCEKGLTIGSTLAPMSMTWPLLAKMPKP